MLPHQKKLLTSLAKVEKLAKGSKLSRLLHHPAKYLTAIFHRTIIYKFLHKAFETETKTFWNKNFIVQLPAGVDIYLTGGKSDSSEIRLAKFMINHLSKGDNVFDIGSHFGYYTTLAAEIVGDKGKVISIEPSKNTFNILLKNISAYQNTIACNQIITSEEGEASFFEFPVEYSEYNTIFPQQFKQTKWFSSTQKKEYTIPATTIDALSEQNEILPDFVKIDTEGAEYLVLSGAKEVLERSDTLVIAMEYLHTKRNNEAHKKAVEYMKESGYQAFIIEEDGSLTKCDDLDKFLDHHQMESDNIIFRRN